MIIDPLYSGFESISKCTRILVILPIGSTEYHASPLPLSTDTLLAEKLIGKYLEYRRDLVDRSDICIFKLPPLHYGYSIEWRKYHGTVTLSPQTFLYMLRDIYRSVSSIDAFKCMIIVNGHGGNASLLEVFARETAYSEGGCLAVVDIWRIASKLGLRYCHACSFEVELAKHLGIRVHGKGVHREAGLNMVDKALFYGEPVAGYKGSIPSVEDFLREFYRVFNEVIEKALEG